MPDARARAERVLRQLGLGSETIRREEDVLVVADALTAYADDAVATTQGQYQQLVEEAVAIERERCARVAETFLHSDETPESMRASTLATREEIAAAIRRPESP